MYHHLKMFCFCVNYVFFANVCIGKVKYKDMHCYVIFRQNSFVVLNSQSIQLKTQNYSQLNNKQQIIKRRSEFGEFLFTFFSKIYAWNCNMFGDIRRQYHYGCVQEESSKELCKIFVGFRIQNMYKIRIKFSVLYFIMTSLWNVAPTYN